MQVYWLTDRTTGEVTLVDGDTVERLLGVEHGYVEWCIISDGVFENEKWRVQGTIGNDADISDLRGDCGTKPKT